jgi:hypothetical protein
MRDATGDTLCIMKLSIVTLSDNALVPINLYSVDYSRI